MERDEWETMNKPRTWRILSHGGVADVAVAEDASVAIAGYVDYLIEHRRDYGYPDAYDLVAVCVETAERVTARGQL